jgi:hypothetical protein
MGKLIAKTIDPKATTRVIRKTITQRISPIAKTQGISANNPPIVVATPLPPLNLRKTEKL